MNGVSFINRAIIAAFTILMPDRIGTASARPAVPKIWRLPLTICVIALSNPS